MQATLKAVSNVLLRSNGDLRQLYDQYSSATSSALPGASAPASRHSFALTQQQMWQMLRDCAVPDADLSMARIDAAMQQVCLESCLTPVPLA